jgi:hypothetical protein
MYSPHPAIPRIRGGSLAALKTFEAFSGLSGVDNLDANLTINGTTKTPTFRYFGGDANGTNWAPAGYGETLTLQAGTAPSYNQGSPCLGANDDSVKFNGGGHYQATSSLSQIATEDFVMEYILTAKDITEYVCATYDTGPGWVFYLSPNGAGSFKFRMYDAGGDVSIETTGTNTDNAWYHVMVFVNRDEASPNGSQVYINGSAAATGVDMSAVSGTLADTDLAIGANASGVGEYNGNLAYAAMWKQASWHQAGASGPAEWATLAEERFLKLSGMYPNKAKGTAIPTTATRTYPAYLDKVESGARKLYYVGGEWLRQCHRQDGSAVDVKGYLSEVESTNSFTYSQDLSNAAWVKTRATVSSNGAVAPDGTTTADGIIGTAVANTHYVGQSISGGAGDDEWSGWLKKANKTWAYLNVPTVANCDVYIDVDNVALGTKGAGMTACYLEDWGNDWVRFVCIYTGGVPAHSHDIYPADADGDNNYTGDGSTEDLWVWGQQHEKNSSGYATSYIPTTSAAATRLKDQLQFVAGANIGGEDVGQGTIVCDLLMPNYNSGARVITQVSDGGAVADRINFLVNNPGDVLTVATTASGGNSGAATVAGDVSDGEKHEARLRYETNNLVLSLDSTDGTADTSVDIADDLDRIDFGMDVSGLNQFNGLISNFRIYKKPVKSG